MQTPVSLHNKHNPPCQFYDVQQNEIFSFGGNLWIKRTTRTAEIFWPAFLERRFYFSKAETVNT